MGTFKELNNWNIDFKDALSKYKVGDNTDKYEDIKNLKPVFAFDFINLDNDKYSFCSELLGFKDYKKVLHGLKKLSSYSYQTLNQEYMFHFHDIKWNEVDILESDFNKCIYGKSDSKGDITPYQFKIYEEARIIGFIYRGVFYLVLFDRGHNAYKRQGKGKGRKKKK